MNLALTRVETMKTQTNLTQPNDLNWYKKDITDSDQSDYTRLLNDQEKLILQNSLYNLDGELSWSENSPKNPILAALKPLYDDIMQALLYQRGFIIVKGFPTPNTQYSLRKLKKLLLEFSANLGVPLKQNKDQELIFDVKSIEGQTLSMENSRGPYVQEALPLHTDAGAILGMYCLDAADSGGYTLLSSARAIHDEIKKTRPDLLNVLYQPFYVDRRGHELPGALPYDTSPIFAMYDNVLMCQYHQPFYVNGQEKFSDLPKLTPKQLEALSLFDQVALREDIVYETLLEPGSIIFINNERILHGRTKFDNAQKPVSRYLLRIWLNNSRIEHSFPNYLGYPSP
jgi:hypothetical protein